MGHLSKTLPYETTKIAPESTKAEIDGMLHEFVILDDKGRRTCEVTGIRWTELPPNLPLLEFMVKFEGTASSQDLTPVKKEISVRIQPNLLIKRARKRNYGMVNTPAPAQSMRLFYWYLKSKLEAILFGLNDITSEFLNAVLVPLPGGRQETIGKIIIEQIKGSRIPALPGVKDEERIIEVGQ